MTLLKSYTANNMTDMLLTNRAIPKAYITFINTHDLSDNITNTFQKANRKHLYH